MMPRPTGCPGIFITGTDTGVGKTLVCRCLAAYMRAQGLSVMTQKWVQTGSAAADDIAEHAVSLSAAACNIPELDRLRTVYRLRYPASPHMAAALEGVLIDAGKIQAAFNRLHATFDAVLVEGTGGVLVPLTNDLLLADLAAKLSLAAIVVVRNTLGAINHALLSIEALRARRLPVLGLVFNRTETVGDRMILQENIRIIEHLGAAPVMGELPFCQDFSRIQNLFEPLGAQILHRWKEMRP